MERIKSINLLENKKLILWLNIGSIPLLIVFAIFFLALATWLSPPVLRSTEQTFVDFILLAVGLFVLLVIHELIHGIFFKVFNPTGKVKFGFKNGMAYATSPQSYYSKGRFAVICLAPFFFISISLMILYLLGFLSIYAFVFLASIHASACIGDFYWIYLILKAPPKTIVEDTDVGISFYQEKESV